MASVQVSLQLPHSIFEVNLGSGMVPLVELGHGTQPPSSSMPVALGINFYPKLCTHANSRILTTAAAGASPNTIHLGTLRIEIRGAGGSSREVGDSRGDTVMVAYLALEPFLNAAEGSMHRVNIYLASTGVHMGSLTLTVSAQAGAMVGPELSPRVKSATNGLVSIVGLDCLVEEFGCGPALDYDPSNISPNIAAAAAKAGEDPQVKQRKKHQLQTMGDFISEPHLSHHVTHVRSLDTNALIDRFNQYNVAMGGTGSATPDLDLEIHQRKSPRPFRPSSTRTDALLSGIGFNVHVQSLALTALEDGNSAPNKFNGSLFHNVTCGAPADHARGFGNVTVNSSSSNSGPPPGSAPGAVGILGHNIASGGLRRLESKRVELGKIAMDAQTALIHAIASQFSLHASMGGTPIPGSSRRHLHSSNLQIARLRREAIQKMEALNSLTWTCAVRRGNVFSQALGIAITSYLTTVCDSDKVQAGWAENWVRHGYLITFEGLLSAAGKELGMIEDAATGIAMLRMVNVVICQEHEGGPGDSRVPVVHSPHIRWVDMTASGVGSSTEYHLRIGIDPAFYAQRIPAALQNGTVVKFFPLLFQMGVDIRQWGANAGQGLKNQIKNNVPGGGQMTAPEEAEESGGAGGLLDDEDDDVGTTDNDFLIALNYEAFGKMNAYVNLIAPVSASPLSTNNTVPAVHPMLSVLQDYIRSSAGKMHHGVLDEAASATQKLGGGGAIFCKSGKDRTAMQVTFKQAQFVQQFQRQVSRDMSSNTDPNPVGIDEQAVINDATLMRIHGTRLPICEKNVGQSKFAFNALQSKFMPEVLKPPPSTLAGFLKGGRVFSREGGIES
uniref:Phosphatidylinositol-3,4-bisphosphate 4-phosphatase n=1 Tax=Attheya septentrionalis TaxID=420275 RepID=A0A7S2UR18_9STRA